MNKIEFIKKEFTNYYIDNGNEHGILQGTKYAGKSTHCTNCLNTIVRMIKPERILEIGSFHYSTTTKMAEAMDSYNSSGYIDTFDIRMGGYDGNGNLNNLHN